MFRLVGFICVCAALTPYLASAMTAEQKQKIHEHFETIGMKCMKDHHITEADITDLRAKKVPSGPEAPCFLACVMKDIGVMDGNGLIQKETALELAKKVFEDAEELKMIEDYLHSCAHVNTEPVSDGDKGCDRAIIAMKCMIENASQFGFEL
uniref:Odorant-binding protein 14 n=2 Tax=Ectropis TaxID=248898 RepID=A0A1L2BLC2_ECTOB|nr:odorant-binding protein 14 [Ectropis obliqua]